MLTNDKTLRVLIVDDHRDGADTLGLIVEELGHQVRVTYGGLPALEVAMAFRPDLTFVDLVMPGMNGFDLVRRMREMPAFDHTKIVVITGHKGDEYQTLAREAGCDLVFIKPVALGAVQMALSSLIPAAAPTPPRAPVRAPSRSLR